MDECKKTEIEEVNGFSLINCSDVDDFLHVSTSDAQDSREDNVGDILTEDVQQQQPLESLELEQPKRKSNYNLRKSLAWDSAFFTCAGVLDPEELSSIIEGAEIDRKQKHLLPGIQEDLSKSTDSISTFESDALTLESLEADLFCDIRASIQRCSKGSNLRSMSSNNVPGETESKGGSGSKTDESPSGVMVKPKSASKKLNDSVQVPGKTIRLGSAGAQLTKFVPRNRDSSSLLPRTHEVAHKTSSMAAAASKRMSLSANRVKSETNNAGSAKVSGQGALLSKVPHPVHSRGTMPKAMTSLKSSKCASIKPKTGIPSSRSSCDSSTSSSSESNCRSPSSAMQRKTDRTVTLASNITSLKTSAKVGLKSKSQLGNSRLSAFVKSTSKNSCSISPASSISEWSSESSSSSATVNKKLLSAKRCSTSGGVVLDSNALQNHHSDQASTGQENHFVGLPGASRKHSSTAMGSCSHPVSAKPSGLRMPSPKMGFFDGVKTGGRTPGSSLQSRSAIPSSLLRSGAATCSPSSASTKGRLANVPVKTTAAAGANSKLDTLKTSAKTKQANVLDESIASGKVERLLNDENHDGTLSQVQNDLSLMSGEGLLENTEVPDVAKYIIESGLDETKNSSVNPLQNKLNSGGKSRLKVNHETAAAEDGANITDESVVKRQNVHSSHDDTYRMHVSIPVKLDVVNASIMDEGGIRQVAVNDATKEKQYIHAQEEEDVVESCVREINQKTEIQRESNDFAEATSHAAATQVTSGARTPFAVKNLIFQMEAMCNSSRGSTVKTVGNTAIMPSLSTPQKENS
ncbi:hypothetical protein Ancab_014652 [Ancistrocladus abbreviatus]